MQPTLTGACFRPNRSDASSESILRDGGKCIHCGRRVDACNHVVMHELLGFPGRGYILCVAGAGDQPLRESACVRCGDSVLSCPTGVRVVAVGLSSLPKAWTVGLFVARRRELQVGYLVALVEGNQ